MIWLTEQERLALSLLGLAALMGLGVLYWQQRREPLRIVAGPEPPYAQWDAMIQQAKQVDINRATAAELERLPEIGPSLAKDILAYRAKHGAFRRPEELQEVPGIGPKTYDALQDYVRVE